ncbi:MAG UNVERIFIED_CONTAM: hypothetical protein LVQ98_02575 [Rickettsiaceae bacterium]|jgi:hypothetical protein
MSQGTKLSPDPAPTPSILAALMAFNDGTLPYKEPVAGSEYDIATQQFDPDVLGEE